MTNTEQNNLFNTSWMYRWNRSRPADRFEALHPLRQSGPQVSPQINTDDNQSSFYEPFLEPYLRQGASIELPDFALVKGDYVGSLDFMGQPLNKDTVLFDRLDALIGQSRFTQGERMVMSGDMTYKCDG